METLGDTHLARGEETSSVVEAVLRSGRNVRWELVDRLLLDFPTYHPQGIARVGPWLFLSSVQVPTPSSDGTDSAEEGAGSGLGHVFVMDTAGSLVCDIQLAEGDVYHPGGIDFDGDAVWVPVAEYHPGGRSIVFSIDPQTLQPTERFRVDDHVGWVVSDPFRSAIHGGSWGSRTLSTWDRRGVLLATWQNPSSFVDYQDAQFLGDGKVVCGGIAELSAAPGEPVYELGGIAVVDFEQRRILSESPVTVRSPVGHVLTRNPIAVTVDAAGLLLYVAPDNGDEGEGTEVLSYRAVL